MKSLRQREAFNLKNTGQYLDFDKEQKLSAIDRAIQKIEKLYSLCCLCGQRCMVDRQNGRMGVCKVEPTVDMVKIASTTLHFGEEPMLVGDSGSGTVFFSNCNLSCVYCQNYQISHEGLGENILLQTLAERFLDLQNNGAININFVSATHVLLQALKAFRIATEQGLTLPLVYNTNNYDSIEVIDALEGVVDIYLPDIKYMDNSHSKKYSNAKNYFNIAIENLKLMYDQVGQVVCDENKNAYKGLIIRHLVLPNNISGSYDILIALSECGVYNATLSIMSQYSPKFEASNYSELNTTISKNEYDGIVDYASSLGFENILAQEFESQDNYLPDFNKQSPF